ncbi:MAG: BREX-2 system adenine-specific DNA-methyltransferase PglX [Myxococcales bacterium]|nr:BREX-2 system adenine-specific DNA-methyltransferase PglX [Myxococcales bacterium]
MKANDRARLTTALRDHVAKIAADLRAKMRASGSAARMAAEQLHKDERVAEDFEVWTDLLSRRAAVLWVLKSVYVRVLEDRGLLQPGRLLDPEAQQLFEKLAPNLGETAFLRWIYKDLASANGGVPELFSPQPAEVAEPSDELSRALIGFWRHRDADTGAVWSFAEEKFEGELMGDLYQELDPVVKDRFALCQTPDFVRAFILDRTLTPAIDCFGADEVRLLDPACGSGHFLIDGLKRLVATTAAKHGEWDRAKVVAHALERVVGVDINDYACALARTRLIMTAAELAGVTKLAEAARFHPHVYWADGLEQVEREEQRRSTQFDLFTKVEEKPRATLTRSDVRAALKKVFEKNFHAVVANPPYITEKDAARKEYHREKVGKSQRYVSAYREYSLSSPFIERCFQLAEHAGFVGLITSNNFMKREFGKPLIEKVLACFELSLVVDVSQAYIPFHGTPTVLLFGRRRQAESLTVRAVMGKRGESGTPEDPARGKVWLGVAEGWARVGFDSEYVTVADVPRATLNIHPWSLGGGGAAELRSKLEAQASQRLGEVTASIGSAVITGNDELLLQRPVVLARHRVVHSRPMVGGDTLRDWASQAVEHALWPNTDDASVLPEREVPDVIHFLWPYRSLLRTRRVFGTPVEQRGIKWWGTRELYRDRFATKLSIAFAKVATHNHFVLDRGDSLFSDGSPVLKLPVGASEDDHLALLGLLNSSTACFWMKQVFHNKGGGTDSGKMQSDPAKIAYEFPATGLERFPVPRIEGQLRSRLVVLAHALDALATERASQLDGVLPADITRFAIRSAESLRSRLADAESNEERVLERQVAIQEEIDWLVYRAFSLIAPSESESATIPNVENEAVGIGGRPFEILQARSGRAIGVDGQALSAELPKGLSAAAACAWAARVQVLSSNADIALIEVEHYKRRWLLTPKHLAGRVETFADRLANRLKEVFADLVEQAARSRVHACSVDQLVADLQDDVRVLAVSEVLTGRKDFSLSQLVASTLHGDAVPSHRFHVYKPAGLVKREVWERTWADQRREDAGEKVTPEVPPAYGSGDFLKPDYWRLRGKLDVPKERFIAFTEVPGRAAIETLYGWAGWTAQQRVKAILAIDEELEDASVPLADRVGLLDSAWRLLPDVAREDTAAANRLKAELQALVGPEGPSVALIEDWQKRFPPPSARAGRARRTSTTEVEEDETHDHLPSVIPDLSDEEHAAILIWALLHASGGTATRMDLARAFALRARPALLKKLAPASLEREVAHWVSTVGSRSVKSGLLASTLSALAARSGVTLGTNREGHATVSATSQTPSEARIDDWFLFEADLALKVLRAQPEEKLGAIDKALTGADRKLLGAAA